jgi:UDPglucose 6-dehydrogenase
MVQILTAKGVRVSLFDPFFSEENSPDPQLRFKRSLSEAVEGSDCVVISASHDQFRHLNLKKLKMMMKKPSAIVDLEALIEPDKVEKEGFIYRGLGRGVWTK